MILSTGPVFEVPRSELQPTVSGRSGSTPDSLEEAERKHILTILNETGWVLGGKNGAAVRLGLKRPTLQFRMKKLGIVRFSGG